MGDRSVTGFAEREGAPVIYLYSHWGASSQVADLQAAISAAERRWDDPDYATRIAVSHLVGDDWKAETGYGLSVGTYSAPDLPYVLIAYWESREVVMVSDTPARDVLARIPFEALASVVDENLMSVAV